MADDTDQEAPVGVATPEKPRDSFRERIERDPHKWYQEQKGMITESLLPHHLKEMGSKSGDTLLVTWAGRLFENETYGDLVSLPDEKAGANIFWKTLALRGGILSARAGKSIQDVLDDKALDVKITKAWYPHEKGLRRYKEAGELGGPGQPKERFYRPIKALAFKGFALEHLFQNPRQAIEALKAAADVEDQDPKEEIGDFSVFIQEAREQAEKAQSALLKGEFDSKKYPLGSSPKQYLRELDRAMYQNGFRFSAKQGYVLEGKK